MKLLLSMLWSLFKVNLNLLTLIRLVKGCLNGLMGMTTCVPFLKLNYGWHPEMYYLRTCGFSFDFYSFPSLLGMILLNPPVKLYWRFINWFTLRLCKDKDWRWDSFYDLLLVLGKKAWMLEVRILFKSCLHYCFIGFSISIICSKLNPLRWFCVSV